MKGNFKLGWWRFFGRDFFNDEVVQMMSDYQQLTYIRLLNFQAYEGSIPLLNVCCLRCLNTQDKPERIEEVEAVIAICFVPHPTLPDRLINVKQYENMKEQQTKAKERQQLNSKAGKASAAQRTLNVRSTHVEHTLNSIQPILSPNPSRSRKEEIPDLSSLNNGGATRKPKPRSAIDLLDLGTTDEPMQSDQDALDQFITKGFQPIDPLARRAKPKSMIDVIDNQLADG
ncbi:MAG: hypothetical protein D4R44_06930 [Actinobacteria bacterium]|nr:MAG: hypothetical protein D4R44_06930 [Actinomycetota bacterium]